jgi:hypothetical protein
VIKEGGFPIGFLDSVLRNLLRAADFLPVGYVLGLISMAGDSRFRRLGDRVAGTMVVIEERSSLGSAWCSTRRRGPRSWSSCPSARRCRRGSARPWSCSCAGAIWRPRAGRAGRDGGAAAGPPDGGADHGPRAAAGAGAPPGGGGGAGRGAAMTQDEFVTARKADWDALEQLLAGKRALYRLPPRLISRAASLYRAVCADLMRAQAHGYGPEVVALLDGLAARAHNALYSAPPYRLAAVWELWPWTFRVRSAGTRASSPWPSPCSSCPAWWASWAPTLARLRPARALARHGRADGEGLRRGLRQGPQRGRTP